MRNKGENSFKCAGKSAIPPDKIMISPLVSKVNNPVHLAVFGAHRDCSAVEAAPAARRVPPAGVLGALRCPGLRGLLLDMSRIHPECTDSDPCDQSAVADVFVREEPDEEDEEEDEGDGEKDDEDEGDDGYSEMSQTRRRLRSDVELPVPAQGSLLDFLFA